MIEDLVDSGVSFLAFRTHMASHSIDNDGTEAVERGNEFKNSNECECEQTNMGARCVDQRQHRSAWPHGPQTVRRDFVLEVEVAYLAFTPVFPLPTRCACPCASLGDVHANDARRVEEARGVVLDWEHLVMVTMVV
jgi:hypothetical protein